MKRFVLFLIAMLLFGCGVFAVAQSITFRPWTLVGQEDAYLEMRALIKRRSEKTDSPNVAKVECMEPEHDFGIMPPLSEGSHSFVLANRGNAELILTGGGTSCICTVSDAQPVALKPGAAHAVTLSWTTRPSEKHFQQSATILTNDPLQPEIQLIVHGEVQLLLGSTKETIGFPELLPDGEGQTEFCLVSDVWTSIEVDRIECTSDTIRCVQIDEALPLPPSAQRATTARWFRATAQATAGGSASEKIRVYVRPDENWLSQQNKLRRQGADSMLSLLESDGTMIVELPVNLSVRRRFGLYSPVIKNEGIRTVVELGSHFVSKTANLEWPLVGRFRGEQRPSDIRAELIGIPGLKIRIEGAEAALSNERASCRFVIYSEDKLDPCVFDRVASPGKLRIETPGLLGEEFLELDIYLDVLPNDA